MNERYVVFVRNWYKREGARIIPGPGPKRTLERNLTYDEARRVCEQYNSTHKPGPLSRKAEFTAQ